MYTQLSRGGSGVTVYLTVYLTVHTTLSGGRVSSGVSMDLTSSPYGQREQGSSLCCLHITYWLKLG